MSPLFGPKRWLFDKTGRLDRISQEINKTKNFAAFKRQRRRLTRNILLGRQRKLSNWKA
jgi:hypothetical protein